MAAEIARLRWLWTRETPAKPAEKIEASWLLGAEAWAALDRFDQLQLQAVLDECADARTVSDAGRRLFNVSRGQRSVVNDADRLRKFLARFGLSWEQVKRS